MKKITSLLFVLSFLIVFNVVSVSYAHATITEKNLEQDQKIYEEVLQDKEGNLVEVVAILQEDKLVVNQYINGELDNYVIREIESHHNLSTSTQEKLEIYLDEEIKLFTPKGEQVGEYNVKDFLKADDNIQHLKQNIPNKLQYNRNVNKENIKLNDSPSYPLIRSHTDDLWGYKGYLYGIKDTVEDETTFAFEAWTPVSIITSTLVGFLSGGVITLGQFAMAFGTTILTGAVVDYIEGGLKRVTDTMEGEVFVEQELVLPGFIDEITVYTYCKRTGNEEQHHKVQSGGPYETEVEMIEYGTYLYAVVY